LYFILQLTVAEELLARQLKYTQKVKRNTSVRKEKIAVESEAEDIKGSDSEYCNHLTEELDVEWTDIGEVLIQLILML
jgi:hypothetical protein